MELTQLPFQWVPGLTRPGSEGDHAEVKIAWIYTSTLHNEELLVLLATHNYNEKIKEDEMGVACSTNEGENECI
jgi:hypothetical protein